MKKKLDDRLVLEELYLHIKAKADRHMDAAAAYVEREVFVAALKMIQNGAEKPDEIASLALRSLALPFRRPQA